MNLLTLCQTAMDEIGFSRPSTIAGNTDTDARQLLALANREGVLLAERKAFQKLVKETTFTLVTSQQDYDLPSDFGWIVPNSMWDRDNDRECIGPHGSAEWQYLKGQDYTNGMYRRWRMYNGKIRFDQEITSADNGVTIAYEYVSTHWVLAVDGTTSKERFTADTDTFYLDDDLMIMGLKWRFKKAKGFDWQDDYQEYITHFNLMIGRDGGQRVLSLGGEGFSMLGVNIPDGDFGQ